LVISISLLAGGAVPGRLPAADSGSMRRTNESEQWPDSILNTKFDECVSRATLRKLNFFSIKDIVYCPLSDNSKYLILQDYIGNSALSCPQADGADI
jgi:hypothetical protein